MASFSCLCEAQLQNHCSLSCSFPVLPAPGLLCFTEQELPQGQDNHTTNAFDPYQLEAFSTKNYLHNVNIFTAHDKLQPVIMALTGS